MRSALSKALVLLCLSVPVSAQDRPNVHEPQVLEGPQVVTLDPLAIGTTIIENLHIRCTSPDQTALSVISPTALVVVRKMATIRNLIVEPGCATGIRLVNIWFGVIDGASITGGYGDFNLGNGIIVEGQTHGLKISKALIVHATNCVLILEVAEGTTIDGMDCLGSVIGIAALATYAGRPWLAVLGSHFDVSRAGVLSVNRNQVTVSDSLFYRSMRGWPVGDPWQALLFINSETVALRSVLVDCQPNPDVPLPGEAYPLESTRFVNPMGIMARNCS